MFLSYRLAAGVKLAKYGTGKCCLQSICVSLGLFGSCQGCLYWSVYVDRMKTAIKQKCVVLVVVVGSTHNVWVSNSLKEIAEHTVVLSAGKRRCSK